MMLDIAIRIIVALTFILVLILILFWRTHVQFDQVSQLSRDASRFFAKYQTLIAGFVAAIVGLSAVLGVQEQIKVTRDQMIAQETARLAPLRALETRLARALVRFTKEAMDSLWKAKRELDWKNKHIGPDPESPAVVLSPSKDSEINVVVERINDSFGLSEMRPDLRKVLDDMTVDFLLLAKDMEFIRQIPHDSPSWKDNYTLRMGQIARIEAKRNDQLKILSGVADFRGNEGYLESIRGR